MERTLRCDEARLLMIDGLAEVPPRPTAALAAHLAACPDCRAEWDSLAGTVTTLERSGGEAESLCGEAESSCGEAESLGGPAPDRQDGMPQASGDGVAISPGGRGKDLPGPGAKADVPGGPGGVNGSLADQAVGASPREGVSLSGSTAASAGDRVLLARLWTAVERRVRRAPQEVPPRRASPAAAGEPVEPVPLSLGWRLVNYAYLLVLAICLYAGLASWQPHFLELAALAGLPVDSWLVAEYGIFLVFYSVGGFTALLAAPLLIKGKDDPHPFVAWVGRQFGLLAGRMGVLACW